MSNNSTTVRVHFAGYVDLCVDANANPVVLASEVARDVEYELSERWRPAEDPSSRLAGDIDEHPLVSIRPLFGLDETAEERLKTLLAAVKQWEGVDGGWVDFRDQYRDEHGDETDTEAVDRKILGEYFQKFWDAGDEVKSAAALLLSTLTPLKHEN
ncbi:hypothetical protein [Streptomyces sp. CB03238]|uniref:hypothetical protein n=1 Tax=Streptomyces sp. CB03238 TaxID=1907777 RepID=UPI000A1095A7|nr:hypothetical protein [Streptomyces sp. CB03238]ORT58117.1 hypothetical protein BKD26_19580 [Streptomyces sp. CB03238]